MKKIKVMSVFGTRPEAIKMAPLVLELERREEIESICCVTAQHREMLDSVLEIFKIKPDFDLDIMKENQTLHGITSKVLEGMEKVLAEAKPDIVLVHGDTSTTFSGALSAFYSKIKVGHVEAGLRTFDRYSPFPEEMNRRLVGQIAELHFCPTAENAGNLNAEGIKDGIFITGNTVIDAMRYTVRKNAVPEVVRNNVKDYEKKRIITVTCHRRENYGQPMENIFSALRYIAESFEDVEMIYPVHLSPIVREAAYRILGGCEKIHLTEPLDAVEMHELMSASYMVMTDSGGIQEEAPALGKPVLVLRTETERPEAIRHGTAKLAGVEKEKIISLAKELLTVPEKYKSMANAVNPYGDGRACERIADAIIWSFGLSDRKPDEFDP